MADFLISYEKTSRAEGGYTNNHDDNGNWTGGKVGLGQLVGTNLGISAPVLSAYLGHTATLNDMVSLTHQDAKNIYKKNYWAPIKGDLIQHQVIADSIYDCAVNMGTVPAIKIAQRAAGISDSGKMDAITLDTLNKTEQ